MFGGWDEPNLLSGIYVLDLGLMEWRELEASGRTLTWVTNVKVQCLQSGHGIQPQRLITTSWFMEASTVTMLSVYANYDIS